ncbi:MAG: galactokinase [Litorimonas sp.]
MVDIFESAFGAAPAQSGFTPGRVNLIGEHTDYNGGMVLPMALKQGLFLTLSPRQDHQVHIISDKFGDVSARNMSEVTTGNWSDYVLGAIIYANKAGFLSGGANVAIQTDLPIGAGLSSSAAVIVGLLKLARNHAGAHMRDADIAVLARRVENEFIGVPCGIMDQMAVAIAQPDQALALNTKSLDYDVIGLPQDYHMAVIHSGVYRQLNEGRYKARKEECDIIKSHLGRQDICLMSDAEFETLVKCPDNIRRRAHHCMSEHRRTVKAVDMLKSQHIQSFGKLMIDSHVSMRDDFDITVPQIDVLVEDAVKFGALGARMTGGGFGGCIVACIRCDLLPSMTEQLLSKHKSAFFVS